MLFLRLAFLWGGMAVSVSLSSVRKILLISTSRLICKDSSHTETEYLLKSRASVTTFTALSPDLGVTRIQALMADKKVGVFNITGCWLGDTPTVRRYRYPA